MPQFRLPFSLLSTIVVFSNLIPLPPDLFFSIYLFYGCQSDFSKKQDYHIAPLLKNLQWIIVFYRMKPKFLSILCQGFHDWEAPLPRWAFYHFTPTFSKPILSKYLQFCRAPYLMTQVPFGVIFNFQNNFIYWPATTHLSIFNYLLPSLNSSNEIINSSFVTSLQDAPKISY